MTPNVRIGSLLGPERLGSFNLLQVVLVAIPHGRGWEQGQTGPSALALSSCPPVPRPSEGLTTRDLFCCVSSGTELQVAAMRSPLQLLRQRQHLPGQLTTESCWGADGLHLVGLLVLLSKKREAGC